MLTGHRVYDDCFILFKYFGGRNISRIEREMRSLGHTGFNRRILYSRRDKGIYRPGWIAKYKWDEIFTAETAAGPQIGEDRKHPDKNGHEQRSRTSSTGARPFPKTADAALDRPSFSLRSDTGFRDWLELVSPGMTWHWRHQQHIIERLQKVTDGISKRLMIFLPPRHGKSELVTARYTAFRMQQDPSMNIIVGSYNQRLADRFSRKIRKVIIDAENIVNAKRNVENEERTAKGPKAGTADRKPGSSSGPPRCPLPDVGSAEGSMFPFAASRPANSVSEWETAAGGGFRSVGVGGGVTGFGANLIVIDDPVKSRAEAESETYREKVWEWFNDDLYTRLEPNGAMILIQTRWHEDDLAGRLLKEQEHGGEHWDVISLPAIAVRDADTPVSTDASTSENFQNEQPASGLAATAAADRSTDWRSPGEALCPERFDLDTLERIRRKIGTYSFSALYQQSPTPSDGGTFKREWFKRIVHHAPLGLKWKRGYDLAVSTKTSACYTASFRCAFDAAGDLYIDGGYRKRLEYPEQRRFVIERMKVETDTEHGIELALHGSALLQDLRRERGLRGHMLRGVKVETDKLTRALTWAPLAEEGKIVLVRGAWNKDFLDEISAFPFGRNDDQVDAVSLAVRMLTHKRFASRGF